MHDGPSPFEGCVADLDDAATLKRITLRYIDEAY